VTRLELERRSRCDPRGDEILHDFLLAIDRDRAPARERGEVDAMALARETQLDPVVHEPFALQPLANAAFHEEVHRALLEDSGAHAMLHVLPAPKLEDDGFDSRAMEEMREDEPRR